jgi:hypothetical protein
MTRRWLPRLKPLLLSLLVLAVLCGAVGFFGWPVFYRWYRLDQLTSADLHRRELALNYVIINGPRHPAVIAGAVRKLAVRDRTNFLQIVGAIDRARAWRRPTIPDTAWLRWLDILGREPEAMSRVGAARRLGDLKDLADDPRVSGLVARLQTDADADVRYNALVAAAQLAGSAGSLGPWKPILARAAGDANGEVARQAWLFLGLFHLTGEARALPSSAPPAVTAAMIWAKLHEQPGKPEIATAALNDTAAPAVVRVMAAYALHQSTGAEAQAALLRIIDGTPIETLNPVGQRLLWRSILSLGAASVAQPAVRARLHALAQRALRAAKGSRALAAPIAIAVSYRLGEAYPFPPAPTTQPGKNSTSLEEQLSLLAAIEGAPVGGGPARIPADAPELTRLTWLARAASPSPDDFAPFCAAEDSLIRDIACAAAAERLTPAQNEALAARLLVDYDDRAKMSGAILAGLTGVRPPSRGGRGGGNPPSDLLLDRANAEDVRPVKEVMRVGLWMQGRAPDMGKVIDALFARPDMPKSTLLLAMLHRKSPVPFDYLLNPRGEPPFDLIAFFDTKRWWRIAARYLPKNAPPFWVWSDPELESFQLDVLRNWYLIRRDTLYPREAK